MASLSETGGVEVWKIKGAHEKHEWNLGFSSVKDLINNPAKENQFLITMNSADQSDQPANSVLLFQYSRPQNLVMYWKTQVPFTKAVFCDQSPASYLLIISQNFDFQKVYFGMTPDELKSIA